MRVVLCRMALLALALTAAGCDQRPKQTQCQVAQDALRILATEVVSDRPWILAEPFRAPRFVSPEQGDPENFSPSEQIVAPSDWRFHPTGETTRGPSRAQHSALEAFRREPLKDIASCDDVRRQAEAIRSRLPLEALSNQSRDAKGLYSATRVTLSKPVLSADGSEALVYVSYVAAPLAGSGHVALLKRDANGTWRLAGLVGLWIS